MMDTVLDVGGAAGLLEARGILKLSEGIKGRMEGGGVSLLVGLFIFVDSAAILVDCHS